jgi:hypothetical protein
MYYGALHERVVGTMEPCMNEVQQYRLLTEASHLRGSMYICMDVLGTCDTPVVAYTGVVMLNMQNKCARAEQVNA